MPHRLKSVMQGALEPWLGLFEPESSRASAAGVIGAGAAAAAAAGTPWAILWLFIGAMALDMVAGTLAAGMDPDERVTREGMIAGLGKKLMGLLVVIAMHMVDLAFLAMGADPAEFGLIPSWAEGLVAYPLTVLCLLGLMSSEILSVWRNARRVRGFGPIVTGLFDRLNGPRDPGDTP